MKIYFVRIAGSKGDSYDCQEAFKIFINKKTHPVHITEAEALKVSINENVVFVVSDLNSGVATELSKKNARIISPYVVLYLKHESERFHTIPMREYPIMSQCLRSLIITSTGFSEEDDKQDIKKKILSMCGLYQPQLDSSVNILVAKNILSEKYRVASSLGIPVVTKDWVTQCWDKYQYNIKAGTDFVSKFTVPILYNLQICVSGITLEERETVKELVNSNGGFYSGVMNKSTDVLLSNGVISPKTNLAETLQVAVVTVDWLHESIKRKYAVSFEDYRIRDFLRDDRYEMMLAEEAAKTGDKSGGSLNDDNKKQTLFAPITAFDTSDQTAAIENIQNLCNKLKNTDTLVLEDLTIFVIGFGPQLLRALKRACTLAGAIFINSQLDSSATQIIVGPQIADISAVDDHMIESLKKMMDKVVSIDWLIDSLKALNCCDVKHYAHNPFEPSAKRSARLVDTGKENDHYSINKSVHHAEKPNNFHSPMKRTKFANNDNANSAMPTLKYLIFSGYDNPKELFSERLSEFKVLDGVPTDKDIVSSTCLVINELNTSEKVLSAIAAGVYILKDSFLECDHYTTENAIEHEWAEELKNSRNKSSSRILSTDEQISLSARSSRAFFHKTRARMFEDVSVLIMNFSEELESIARILEAGGASVFRPTTYNYRHCLRSPVTFALMDLKNYSGTRVRDDRMAIKKCVLKYSQEDRLFHPKVITHYLCLLDKSSCDLFTQFEHDSSILPDFLRKFLLTPQELSEHNL